MIVLQIIPGLIFCLFQQQRHSCNLSYTNRWIQSKNTSAFLVHSEQLLGSIYRGICIKATVMSAKSISVLIVWEEMVVLYVPFALFPLLEETLYWLSKMKGKKALFKLTSHLCICMLTYVCEVCAHICVYKGLSFGGEWEFSLCWLN